MIDIQAFKNGMSQLTSAVNIVTTNGKSGQHGFTASAVCSVTDSPPTLLVCMNANARSYEHFVKNGVLAVNVLANHHQALSNVFASKLTSAERFAQGAPHIVWRTSITGAPILDDALASFDCRIEKIIDVGTHSIFICPIEAVEQTTHPQALAYFNRHYQYIG